MGRRDCAVVEKTKAAGQVAIGVMTRRTAECVSRVLAVHHELSRRCRHIGSRARGSPGAGADRTGRIDRMPAETADNVGRVRRGVAHRMHVGDHLGACIPQRGPSIPCLGEKTKKFRTMDPCPRPLPESARLNQIVIARLKSPEQPIGAFRLLGGALDDAANQKELRVMASMLFVIVCLPPHTSVFDLYPCVPQRCSAWFASYTSSRLYALEAASTNHI